MPARIPLNPAPMTMTLIDLYSSMEKSPRANLPSGLTSSLFALGGMRENPPPGMAEMTGRSGRVEGTLPREASLLYEQRSLYECVSAGDGTPQSCLPAYIA